MSTDIVLRAGLREHLPRMLARLRLLPPLPERDKAIALAESVERHWNEYGNNETRKSHVLGLALFVGEVEHLARIDLQIASDAARRARQAEGGRNKAAPDWHAACVSAAHAMLATGTSPRDLTSKLARRFGRDRTAVLTVLKKAGVK